MTRFGTARSVRDNTAPTRAISSSDAAKTVIIIGGGASGVLLTLQLLAEAPATRVVLIERTGQFGRGLAYGTRDPEHLLNVPPTGMSAYPDQPQHFWHWLKAAGRVPVDANPFTFVARHHFGDYLAALLADANRTARGRLTLVAGEVTDLIEQPGIVRAALRDGRSFVGDIAVLATGHAEAASADHTVPRLNADEQRPVLILGAGLSMVDRWLSLRAAGYRGTIVVLSRHGLLPNAHTGVAPIRFEPGDVPVGTGPLRLMRWLRRQVAKVIAEGGDWRAVTDGIRPFTQDIWAGLDARQRRQFLTHARAAWDVHRHRLAPEIHARLRDEVAHGGIVVIAGHPHGAKASVAPQQVTYRHRGHTEPEASAVAAVIDCRGLAHDVSQRRDVIGALVARHRARPDALHIGLDVTHDCRLVRADGTSSDRIWAVGPLTRGAFFEIEAVPDIRMQARRVALMIAALDEAHKAASAS